MNALSRLLLLLLALTAGMGCAAEAHSAGSVESSEDVPDADIQPLIALSEEAAELARSEAPEVTLRQIYTDLSQVAFGFTDSERTKEINVSIPAFDAPTDEWTVQVNTVSPVLTNPYPGIDLAELCVGPQRVAEAIMAHWPGCTLWNLILYRDEDGLEWIAFCQTPDGLVSGMMDNQTGIFAPAEGPPARMAVTATPLP